MLAELAWAVMALDSVRDFVALRKTSSAQIIGQTSKSLQQFSVNVKYASETAHELLILLKFEGVFRRDPLQLARPVGMI